MVHSRWVVVVGWRPTIDGSLLDEKLIPATREKKVQTYLRHIRKEREEL